MEVGPNVVTSKYKSYNSLDQKPCVSFNGLKLKYQTTMGKKNQQTTIWSRNSTHEHLSESNSRYFTDVRSLFWKYICTLIFIVVLFIITEMEKQPKCLPMNEWKKYDRYIEIMHIGILFSHHKKGNPATCDNMNETLC